MLSPKLCLYAASAGLLLTICCGFSSTAFAQTPPPGTSTAPPSMQVMAVDAPENKLHLTADQQKKFQAIFMQAAQQQNVIVQNKSLTDAQKKAQLIALRGTLQTQEKTLMTPEQLATINQHEAVQVKYYKAIVVLGQQIQQQQKALLASLTPTQKTQATAIDQQIKALAIKLQNDPKMPIADKSKQYQAATAIANAKLMKIYTPAQKASIEKLNNNEREIDSLKKLYMEAGI